MVSRSSVCIHPRRLAVKFDGVVGEGNTHKLVSVEVNIGVISQTLALIVKKEKHKPQRKQALPALMSN